MTCPGTLSINGETKMEKYGLRSTTQPPTLSLSEAEQIRLEAIFARSQRNNLSQIERRHHVLSLTPREAEILQLVANGETNKEIAVRLWLSEETVKSHMKRLIFKLAVANRAHAVAEGFRRGFLT